MAQAQFNVKILSDNARDGINRQTALQTLQDHGSTAALEFLAELVVKKGASEKLLSKKGMIKAFF